MVLRVILNLDYIFVLLYMKRTTQYLAQIEYGVTTDVASAIWKYNNLHMTLMEDVECFRKIITFMIYVVLVRIWSSVYSVIYYWMTNEDTTIISVFLATVVWHDIFKFVVGLNCCEEAFEQENRIKIKIYEILHTECSQEVREQLKMLSVHILLTNIQFPGHGFKLTMALLYKGLGIIMIYLIILMQFKS
ncbi:uncharacterized protein LOC116182335 [Photinus pyralis]|uniref:uncharacterized protein LOC116182008 n=1 Tax=Photinus pyralis TaxID=7054 RepID=UPI0012671C11|nr:uncharacterized protein LOC116182008 [Photinus pyralis]XP_031358723.1 uncharacterized protein LOC116182335 [Photinus pyralis]